MSSTDARAALDRQAMALNDRGFAPIETHRPLHDTQTIFEVCRAG
jgi:hypothetical protein